MSANLRTVLDGIDEESSCGGSFRTAERIALALPDGDVGAVDDSGFVEWLLAHAEPAPFGKGGETIVDKKVRSAQRLVARDKVEVHGFEPSAILDEIEATLSPGWHLDARLTDVVISRKGDKFLRHKDTPRSRDLVGTLVVALPIAHEGGAFHVNDGREPRVYDWSGTPEAQLVNWAALFSDVDHEIKPVTSGARVTLVYVLLRSERPRSDAVWTKRQQALQAACRSLRSPGWPLMIACGRQVIAEPDQPQPQPIETLRGIDRELAEALVEAGFKVGVRACIAAAITGYEGGASPDTPFVELGAQNQLWGIDRLRAVPPPAVLQDLVDGDEGEAAIDDYRLDSIMLDRWIIRRTAAATLVHEAAYWAEQGNFGNEGYEALLYTLAALEVSKSKPKAKPAKRRTAKKPATKPAAKKPAKTPAKKPTKKR